MFKDKNKLESHPFHGEFFEGIINEGDSLLETTETEVSVCEVDCDIQEASHARPGGRLQYVYSIFCDFDKSEDIPVRAGMTFKGEQYGVPVVGRVFGVSASQLGGYVVYVQQNEM